MAAFLEMGGYAAFVWPCYAITAIGMLWIALSSWRWSQKTSRTLAALSDSSTQAKN